MEEQIKEGIAQAILKTEGKDINITYLTGEALEPKEPTTVSIDGTIDAPARWCENRHFDDASAHIIVNREEAEIYLCIKEHDHYKDSIIGCLKESKESREIGINDGKYITAQQMAERIKMHRSYFANRQEAMKLVSDLQNFRAKVNKRIQEANDNRGNRDLVYSQAVESNLPKAFTLFIPLFTGQPRTEVVCEVYINPADLTCTLVSAAATEIADDIKNTVIDGVLKRIKETEHKDIVIIEV